MLNPNPPVPSDGPSDKLVESPPGVRKGSVADYKYQKDRLTEMVMELKITVPTPEEVPGLLTYKKVVSKKTQNQRCTNVHGKEK